MNQKPEHRRFMSLTAAAEYADVSVRSLRRWIADGRLPGYRVGPAAVKVKQSDVDKLIQRIPTARPDSAA